MGKFTGVLLASDFDNTIVDTASSFRGGLDMPAPSERTLEALDYFMKNGGAFTVATGRALASFQRLVDGVPMADLLPAFVDKILAVASGDELARNEENDYREISIFKNGVTL